MGAYDDSRVAETFRRLANGAAHAMGSHWAFAAAISVVIVWAAVGPLFGFSEAWQLVINTGTTIVTFMMIFLVQTTQNRDARAIHLKLDELIRTTTARNEFADIEDANEGELDRRQHEFEDLRRRYERGASRHGPAHTPARAAPERKARNSRVASKHDNRLFHLLLRQHRSVEGLITKLAETSTAGARRRTYSRMKAELFAHAHAVEKTLYAAVKDAGHERVATRALREHAAIEQVIEHCDAFDADDTRWREEIARLDRLVRRHVEREETDIFDAVLDELTSSEIDELADKLAEERREELARLHREGSAQSDRAG